MHIRIAASLIAMIASLLAFTASPTQAAEVVNSWSVKTVTLPSGRTFYVNSPNCTGGCTTPRQLVIYTHGAGGPEDLLSATQMLNSMRAATPNVVYAYSVSAGGTKRFDVGVDYCCTFRETHEVWYLINIVQHMWKSTRIDPTKIKLIGSSNGGMLSERAICQRPDIFAAAASWAGTWRSTTEGCSRGKVNIRQWHGTADPVVPIDGGRVYLFGRWIDVPPAAELGTKLVTGSKFAVVKVEGAGHMPSGAIGREMVLWLHAQSRV